MSREHVYFVSPAPRTMSGIQGQTLKYFFFIIYPPNNNNEVKAPSLSTQSMRHKNDMQDYLKNTNSLHRILMVFILKVIS